MFRRKEVAPTAEQNFKTILNIVKNYDKREFTKLMDAVQKCWEGYDIVLRARTRDEKQDDKEFGDINAIERSMEKEK